MSDPNTDDLRDLASKLLKDKSFKITTNVMVNSVDGSDHLFDFLIDNPRPNLEETPLCTAVIIKDYKKRCGTDVVNQAEKAANGCRSQINKVFLISNEFSASAQNLARRAGILTLDRNELTSILKMNNCSY